MRRDRPSPWPTEQNRVLLLCGLSFWAGCLLAERIDGGAWLWALAGVACPLAFLLWKLGKRAGLALALVMAALGALRAGPCFSPDAPEPGRYASVTGYVYGEPRLRADRRVTFTLTDVVLDGVAWDGRAYCSLYYGDDGAPTLFDGAHVAMPGRVYLPQGKSGEPRFDFRMWMLRNGMRYGIALSQGITVHNTPDTAPVKDWAYRLRQRCRAALTATMGQRAELAMAMLLNDRQGVSEQEYESFQTLGVAHVFTVSGLHVGWLGTLLMWMMERLRLRRGFRFVPLALFLAFYCTLTGASAATIRASVALLLALLAQFWGRRTDPLAMLGATMLAVLLLDPLEAGSAGFLLSFSAVAAILLLSPTFGRALDRLLPDKRKSQAAHTLRQRASLLASRLLRKLKGLVSMSAAAQLGVLLPTAAYFHSVPLYGVVINLFVIPFSGLLTPLYALALLFSGVPGLNVALGGTAAVMSGLLTGALGLLSRLPYACVRTPSAPWPWPVAGMVILLIASRALRASLPRKAAAILLVCAVAGGAAYLTRPPDTRYVQLSVGQADAALLFAGDQTVAIDVGADGTAVVDYLMAAGRDLDALILTHLHLDHAGGAPYLLDAGIRVKQVYLPVNAAEQRLDAEALAVLTALSEAQIPIRFLAKGDELRYNEVTLRVLWPDGAHVRRGQDANDLPLALAVDLGGYTLFQASDLTGSYERYAAVPCDVLKVAHHGGNASTSDAFLAFANPAVAIVSCSSASRSLPGADTLNRLNDHGARVYRTDETGDITLWAEDGRLHILPYQAR